MIIVATVAKILLFYRFALILYKFDYFCINLYLALGPIILDPFLCIILCI